MERDRSAALLNPLVLPLSGIRCNSSTENIPTTNTFQIVINLKKNLRNTNISVFFPFQFTFVPQSKSIL